MRNLKLIPVCVAVFLLSACTTTPDLSSFAEESKQLRASIGHSHTELIQKVGDLNERIGSGKTKGWVKTDSEGRKPYEVMTLEDANGFRSNTVAFDNHVATIDATLSAMVAYSDALSNLAAAGETGKESVQSLKKSVSSITSTLGIAYPPSAIAYEGFTELLAEVADLYTRVEAQESLASAMSNATPAVDKLALTIQTQSALLEQLTVNVMNLRIAAVRGHYGSAKIGYFEKFNAYKNMEKLYGSILTDCSCDRSPAAGTPLPKYCTKTPAERNDGIFECHLTRETALTSRLTTLGRINDEHSAYVAAIASEQKWAKSMLAQLKAASAAAAAWASTHQQATTLLIECGGKKSLTPSCGNLTVDNLQSAIDRLKNIKQAF